ncbi:hypothetical protein THASP1DRAFT_20107 [Thamnocephalis sphaerospora]|uniref:Cora-like Mg2+ transporter protein-domain-containing protein n=1 Tax=Thamnocephalis sphaerospora TaxID=78915 RepID=A0A4P9XHK9_9FUNG|nr:hypothetical protein THASP1DRAFT_20107 [Thamnocephalis sphaerospora]|eukprot:RKP05184.1 hypothetical protein THASP1DRAFT_20107 [Thamnocephalis sphaerospora]
MATLFSAAPFWLDVTAPTLEDMHILQKVFRIHPLTVEDILTEDTREKCELYPHYYFCCFRSFDPDPNSITYLEPISVFSVVAQDFVLTFHRRPYVHATNVLHRIRRKGETEAYADIEESPLTVTPGWINYALIDDVTDSFAPLMAQLQLEVDSIDELVLILRQSEQADMLRRMGEARRLVITLTRLLASKPDVVRSLIKWRQTRANDEILVYLSDIQDHLLAMVQNVYHYERIISRAHANYLGQINVEMTKSSNSTNKAVAWLTTMGTVLVPMHVIGGLWGMNVNVPGQDTGLGWFFGIMAAMIIVSTTTLLIFRPDHFRTVRRYLLPCSR